MTLTEAVSAIELKETMEEDSSDSTSCCDDTSHSMASSDITSVRSNSSIQTENSRSTDGDPLLKAPHCFREATILERVRALWEGKENVGEASRGEVKESQQDAILRGYNSAANVAQNLMLAANIERIFSLQQLRSRDLARIDVFLKDDLYLTFR
ncbi:unnamed protein product [Heligmosomoides polygyrus]|uniref:NR LBD domain-containing protein n=1 Tax=Heligmosomoides polygyrus TaxID=6339 RepID=A0A183F9C0_HELPZ|nr:unnamed protein product [Heligmosomoides polygyrus]